MKTTIKFIFILILISNSFNLFSQVTKIRGTIIEAGTNEALPFVNINFKGTTVGCISDFDGNYSIETREKVDTLVISYIGYKTIKKKINIGSYQKLDFTLETESIALDEVTITPGENPAYRIIRNIIKNKEKNNPDRLNSYQYEVYNKMQIDINNLDDGFKNKRVFKHFQFVFDYVDTSSISGKEYLPIFISENISDYYYTKNPKHEKEIIKASNISGIENESVTQFTGNMFQKTNIYKNKIDVFGKAFISPFSPFWKMYYKYYLLDSANVNGHWSYQISFRPRSKTEPTFSGDFWVTDTTWALQEVNIKITKDANINLIQDMVVHQKYIEVEPNVWMLKKDKLVVDFNIAKKTQGFFGRKTTIYDKYIINKPKDEEFFKSTSAQTIIVTDSARNKSKEFWDKERKEELTDQEKGIYAMVDTIQKVPIFRTYVDIITTLMTGYYNIGKIEIGPYSKIYSYNTVEGHRFRLGLRTSTDFSEKLFMEVYGAYGTLDLTYKFGAEIKYFIIKNPEFYIGATSKFDVEQLGASNNSYPTDNVFHFVLKRTSTDKLNFLKEGTVYIGKEWFDGLSNKLNFIHRIIAPIGKNQENIPIDYLMGKETITTSEIGLKTRFAFNEKFIYGKRSKSSLGTKYPIINLYLGLGIKDVFSSDYDYQKINISISNHFSLSVLGKTYIYIEGGKIWGTLPFPLLQLQKGNETYWYDDYSFNLMNYYEFITDQYVSAMVTHHFQGIVLNKIPLLKKLKWREVVMGKGVMGNISQANKNFAAFPAGTTELVKPYFEASAGIENIFQILRVDAVWRLSYLNNPNIDKFGIRIKLQIQF